MKATKANLKKIVKNFEKQYPYLQFRVRTEIVKNKTAAIAYDCGVDWSGDDSRADEIETLIFAEQESSFVIFASRDDGHEVCRGEDWSTILVTDIDGKFVVESFKPYPQDVSDLRYR